MDKERPGYFAVIPADVRYDDRIPANAKLLYGEISALVGENGFCYASNAYFSSLYKLSERTITGLIKVLKDNGHISVHIERDVSGQIVSRKIYLRVSSPDEQPLENIFHTPRKDFREGIENICGETNTSITDIDKKKNNKKEKENKTTSAPQAADFDPMPLFENWIRRCFPEQPAQVKNGLYLAADRFVKNRVALKKPYKTAQAVTATCNKLVKLSEGQPLVMISLLDNATEHNWQGIFPLNREMSGAAPKEERQYRCV